MLTSSRRRWTKLTCRGFWARWEASLLSQQLRSVASGSPEHVSLWCAARFFVTVLMMLAGIVVIASLIH